MIALDGTVRAIHSTIRLSQGFIAFPANFSPTARKYKRFSTGHLEIFLATAIRAFDYLRFLFHHTIFVKNDIIILIKK